MEDVAMKHELLSSPYRVAILSIVKSLDEAKWSQIKKIIEEIYGSINPNTLAFHIKKLINSGLLLRKGSMESPIYVVKSTSEIIKEIDEIAKILRERE